MKRLLPLITMMVLLGFGASKKAGAQILTNEIWYAYDSFSNYCVTPTTGNFYVYGIVSIGMTPIGSDSVDVFINWGDGTVDTIWNTPIVQVNYYYAYPQHTYASPGVYAPQIISVTSNGIWDTLVMTPIVISNTCGSLDGTVYLDYNANCTQDVGEPGTILTAVKITNQTTTNVQYVYTDQNGDYNANLPTGYTYTVEPVQLLTALVTPTCPATGSANVNIVSGSNTQDFGFDCTTQLGDLSIMGFATNWREGVNRPISICVSSNTFCDTFDATVTLTIAPPLSFVSTNWNPTPVSQTATTVTWNAADISLWDNWCANGYVYCDTSATLGDTLCATVTINPSPADANAANNTYNVCAEVNNSYDPNDKGVSPKGLGPQGNIQNGTNLNYMIRFQNTGNDTAYQVLIVDSLSSNFNLASLKLIDASHPVTMVLDGSVIKFKFDNIYLPDSNVNEPASHGYVLYSITPNASLALGTQITNEARIYFDYNPAILTNATLNTIAAPLAVQNISANGLQALVYPNPAKQTLNVVLQDKEQFSAELFDMVGRKIAAQNGKQGKAIIDLNGISSGNYILQIVSEDRKLNTKITVQH